MRIFLTGATGFIGSALVPELINAGHQVLGLTRSDAGAASLQAAGAEVHRGNLQDQESLRSGAAQADGVIHCAFVHDVFSEGGGIEKFMEVCAIDGRAIEAMGAVLRGSNRPLIITSGTGMGSAAPGQTATEDVFNPDNPNPRKASEIAGAAVAESGVNVSVMRLPQVHNTEKQGLLSYAVATAREKGISAYVGDGLNRWPAVHVLDAAHLYRLAVETAAPGARYHAVAEEGVPFREMAEAIGRGLKVPVAAISPEEAAGHFGWLGMFAGYDMPASSALTQQRLGWHPTGPGLIEDLNNMRYFKA